ncbi:phosphotransferase [Sphingomonas histidinilytica]|uniref:Phosphotransferase enzyme family protein n=1 Tax=Rhizorhabdus histidinilytica TaxID=439228 RepID=A0A1T4ZY28_9SPHN|nr:aminoglycoside phosphotransferase family protein [Rhizorhabdus histidinilytica]MBO9375958.1 phosphotransferase [Rhizorhabdus histidinilytica]SKB27505.1 Phosphotransferase enzyme family protein [Rhizorhabdus histidinilytica]
MIRLKLQTLIGSGGSADVFRLAGGRVLKLYREGLDPGVIAREHDGVRHAVDQGLHVARAFGTRDHGDRSGIVFEELVGKPLLRLPVLRPFRTRALLRRFADYQARIHLCGAAGLPHHQHDIIHVRIEQAEVGEQLRTAALERLHAIPRGDRFCHGDYHPGNVILTRAGIAAIDWSNASAGDPAGDVARTELLFRYAGYGPSLRNVPPLRHIRAMTADFYLRQYRESTGLSDAAIDAWRLPMAVASLVPGSRVHRPTLIAALERQGFSV